MTGKTGRIETELMIPESFYQAEIRCDYQISEKMKRIWAVELNLFHLFDRFCKANNLQYFAGYGTLLGAVRHKGFIPWDDDMDLVMLRPEYERLKQLAEGAFEPPIFFQASYTSDTMRLITPFAKLRDSRTAAVEYPNAPEEMSQGIFIDIFPLDSVGDGTEEGNAQFQTKLELYMTISDPAGMLKAAEE